VLGRVDNLQTWLLVWNAGCMHRAMATCPTRWKPSTPTSTVRSTAPANRWSFFTAHSAAAFYPPPPPWAKAAAAPAIHSPTHTPRGLPQPRFCGTSGAATLTPRFGCPVATQDSIRTEASRNSHRHLSRLPGTMEPGRPSYPVPLARDDQANSKRPGSKQPRRPSCSTPETCGLTAAAWIGLLKDGRGARHSGV
jgi:hypothetical protein